MLTAAMRSARDVLNLTQLYVICHGVGSPWPLSEGITAVPAGISLPPWDRMSRLDRMMRTG